MRLKPRGWTAAVMLGLASTSALASVVVVKSRGPSAKAYPPGKTLTSATKVTLKSGDVVTILGPGSVRTLRGPGSFDTTQVGLEEASSQRGRFGAMRTGSVAHSPSLWDIDVTQSGKVCVTDAKKLQLWRPQSDGAESVELRPANGSAQKLSWASGKALAAWPATVAVADGGSYEIAWADRPDQSKLEVVTVGAVPKDRVSLAKILIDKGCENQLEMLVAETSKDASAN